MALGAGYVNSWIETYQNQQAPCLTETTQSSISSNCILWLIVGLVIASLQFEKKRDQ